MKRNMRFLALLPLLFLCVCATARAAERAGVVVGLQGKAVAVAVDGAERELATGAQVWAGETLRTEAGAKLQVMLEDDTIISLGERSELLLDTYVYEPNVRDKNRLSVRIGRGLARIISGAITELNPDQFKVRTSRATIGIRGCELGFECDGGLHRYFVVRVPAQRSIHVVSDLTGADLVLRDPALVEASPDGRLRQHVLREADIRDLIEQTTPKFVSSDAGQTGAASRQREAQQPAGETVESEVAVTDEEALGADLGGALSDETTAMNDLSRVVTDIRSSTVSDERDREKILLSSVTPPSPPPPAPLRLIGGGGIGAFYRDDAGMALLQQIYLFGGAAGWLGDGRSAVDFWGKTFDGAGNLIGYRFLSLRDVPLITFGGQAAYEGWREVHPSFNVRLANDNLQEFARRIDFYGSAAQMLYWGIPAERIAEWQIPADSMVDYAAAFCEYPVNIQLPRTIETEVEDGVLKINSRTQAYVFLRPDGIPIYGRMNDLQFFGRNWQGVGASHVRGSQAQGGGSDVMGMALAGFRILGSERPAETGVSMRRGYASGLIWTEDPTPVVRSLHTAGIVSDNPVDNEDRAMIQVNKDAVAGAVAVDLKLAVNPPTPSPDDLNLASPGGGVFVEGPFYATTIENGSVRANVAGVGGGENWSWGVWDADVEIDLGGGGTKRETGQGQYVVGDTLSPAAYQTLVNGAQSYLLQTPLDRPGHMAATVSGPSVPRAFLEGTAHLMVHIPGGGAPGEWRGAFSATDPAGNNLNVHYSNWQNISPNGHLVGGIPDNYILNAGGNAYTKVDLVESHMTGNLVGPGAGPRPVTGAIGTGQFTHGDGTTVNLTYGTDLAP